MCVPGGELEKWQELLERSVSKFDGVRMQMEFPADYTEVKQGGPDKERKNKPCATSR